MRAVLMKAVGGPGVLELMELPEPEPSGEHDVRVRLRAAGINPVDYKLRSYGTFARSLPVILGCDGAGVVEAAGPAVTRVRPGDEVYFCDGGFGPVPGTYQEVKVVDERYLARKPERLSFAEAAAAPLVTITAWEALRERARVGEGQFVLVQGGAGGVGHMSVQIARLAGARVAATVSPGAKTELAASLGVELCIDYRREDVAAKDDGQRPGERPVRAQLVVDRVDPRRVEAHPDVMLPGKLRLGQLCELEHPRAADGRHEHRTHTRLPRCRQVRAGCPGRRHRC